MKKLTLVMAVFFSLQLMSQNSKPETLVVIHTSYGDITAMLYNDTPLHRDNFIKLVNEGWYNGSVFHRIIKNFMIQGGGNADGQQDPGYTIPAEFNTKYVHKKGALSAARMGDQVNPEKRSSGSQFYIVQGRVVDERSLSSFAAQNKQAYSAEQRQLYKTLGGTPHLDGGYTVFGEVLTGFEVIDMIAAVQTGPGDKPIRDVKMTIEIVD